MNVNFEKPKPVLGRIGVDLHSHSNNSDTFTKVRRMLKKAEKKGFGFALTDHNAISGCKELERNKKVLTIPGMEFSSKEGPHILTYFQSYADAKEFYDKHVKKYVGKNPYSATKLSALTFIDKAKDYNAFLSFAHPFIPSQSGVMRAIKRDYLDKDVLKQVEAIEVFCGVLSRRMNKKSISFAKENNKLITGGSDAHSLYQLGSVQTYASVETQTEFLEKLRKGEVSVIGKEYKIRTKLTIPVKIIPKHLRYLVPTAKVKYDSIIKKPACYFGRKILERVEKHKKKLL